MPTENVCSSTFYSSTDVKCDVICDVMKHVIQSGSTATL